jgi:oligosaccharide repeat unit polymerase
LDDNNTPADYLAIIILTLVALGFTAIFISNRGILPLYDILKVQGSSNLYDLAFAAREEFSRYGKGANSYYFQGYFQQFYIVIIPLVVLFFGSKYLLYRNAIFKWLWIVGALLAGLLLAVSLQRWPLMFFILLNYVLYSAYNGKIRYGETLGFALAALLLFGFLTYIRGMEDLEMVATWLVARIFFTQVEVFYSIMEMFPKHFDYFAGAALLGDIKGVLPGPDAGFSRWLFDEYFRVHGNGTAPTLFLGELFADFGYVGIIAGGVLAGFLMQLIYIYFVRGRKNLMRLVYYAFLTMAVAELAVTTPVTVVFQFGVVTIFIFSILQKIAHSLLDVKALVPRKEPKAFGAQSDTL